MGFTAQKNNLGLDDLMTKGLRVSIKYSRGI